MIDENESDEKDVKFKNHLKTCHSCREKLEEFQEMKERLSQRTRPELSKDFLQVYRQNLNTIFPSQTVIEKFREKFTQFDFFLLKNHAPSIRWAGAVCILLLGIVIGKFLLTPDLMKRQVAVQPNVLVFSLTPDDVKLLSDYFVESEMLILTLVNWDETAASEMGYLKGCAEKILTRTPLIEDKVQKMNNNSLAQFVNRLEVILLDFTNARTEETSDIIQFIKESVIETKLDYESNRWQMMLNNLQKDNI